MKEIIAKIGRQNHVTHLMNVMPLITFVFGVQCYLIYKFADGIQVGDYAIMLGATLAFFVSALVYYDNNHHVFICKNHLHVFFPLTGKNFEIDYKDIENILTPEEECNFSSIAIKTKDDKTHVFYFVDFPVSTKMLIEEQMKKKDSCPFEESFVEEESDLAA